MNEKKSKLRMPHVYIILGALLIIVTILTYIIPAGTYDFVEVNGKKVIDAATFHYIDQTPVGIWDMIMAIPQACANSGMLIMCVFLISGAINIINKTEALDATIGKFALAFRGKKIAVPLVMLPFVVLGMMGITEPANVAFIPLGMMLGFALGGDAIVGTAIVLFGLSAGFTMAPFGTSTTANAQTIAGIPVFSGWPLRVCAAIIFWLVNAWLITAYLNKVRKDPQNSLCIDDPHVYKSYGNVEGVELTTRRKLVAIIFALMFAVVVWSVFVGLCSMQFVACVFLVGAILSGIVFGYKPNQICELLGEGFAQIAFGALMIGFASAISLVMTNGNIIHTCVHAAAGVVGSLPPALTAIGMNILNIFVNFFIISGSGQAFVVMPIMSPLAQVVGVTQQTAILAYQLGDGLTNFIYPQSGVLMAALSVSRVSWPDWAKFAGKFIIIQTLIGWALIVFATLTGYGAAFG